MSVRFHYQKFLGMFFHLGDLSSVILQLIWQISMNLGLFSCKK
uniref:Uncharacterized protein n=1 Tax=Rhizophora mucronata TaxID=61149 RepID=A0A2P2ILH0_RHIMU